MAQVTYRGVKYDTDARKNQETSSVDLIYRGHKHSKSLVSTK